MRRITLWVVSTAALLVLIFSYRTSTSGPATAGSPTSAYAPGVVSGSDSSGSGGTGSDSTGSGSTGSGDTGSASGQVVNGAVADTRWGPVQVQVTIASGKLTQIVVLQQPDGNRRDQEINAYAIPRLREQALQAQSANIDGVSGATVTSDGFRESLQDALTAVNFGS